MIEEYSLQQTENTSQVSAPLMAYIDQKITGLDDKIDLRNRKGHNDVELIDLEEAQQERAKLQKMKEDMLKGQYSGIATLLQTEQIQAEQEFASLQKQIRPRSIDPMRDTMPGDLIYFAMKDDILHEQRILAKAEAILDQDDKAYIARKIEKYRSEQYATERGSVVRRMANWQSRVNSIKGLQQLLPRPIPKR